MVPVDLTARGRAAGGAGRLGELAAWVAGVTGAERPRVRARIVVAGEPPAALARLARAVEGDVVRVEAGSDAGPLSVPEVAAAVDAGRELAGAAARDGVTVLAGVAPGGDAAALAAWLTGQAPDPDIRGPLGALHRLGGADLCVLVGVALGAGERGLGYVCDGLASTAAAAVATGIESDLRPRLLAGHRSGEAGHDALLAHLGLEPVLDLGLRDGDGSGAIAALAILRLV